MILDDNLVFTDGTVESGESTAVDLEMIHLPKKVDRLYIVIGSNGALEGVTAISASLLQADTEDGEYTAVDGLSIELTAEDLDGTGVKGYFPLPPVTGQWLKLSYTVTGSVTSGSFFAALTPWRELPYEAGEYIDAGQVKG